MPPRPWSRAAARGIFALAGLTATSPVRADVGGSTRAPLVVLGGLQIEVTRDEEDAGKVRGRVTDELGAARPSAVVRLLERPTRGCGGGDEGGTVTTDERGEFCILLDEAEAATWRWEVRAEGYETYSGAVPPTRTQSPPRFVGAPLGVDLDSSAPVVLEIWSSGSGAGRLVLEVRSARGVHTLAEREVVGAELTRVELPAAALGLPGRVELWARRLQPDAPETRARFPIDLRAAVRLDVVSFERDAERFELIVEVGEREAPPSVGLVEVRADAADTFLASAPLKEGRARIVWHTERPGRRVRLDYVSGSAHHVAPGPRWLELPPSRGLPSSTWWQALASAGLLGWLWLRWSRRRRDQAAPAPEGELTLAPAPAPGELRGELRDAHTGEPLLGVVVELLESTATGERVLATTLTDARGHFSFGAVASSSTRRVVRAAPPTHRRVELPVTRGPMRLRASELRRASLELLSERASERGGARGAGDAKPTPAEASAAWRRAGQDERARWAEEIERWAYGPRAPSESVLEEMRVAWRTASSGGDGRPPSDPTRDPTRDPASAEETSEARGSADIDAKGPHFL